MIAVLVTVTVTSREASGVRETAAFPLRTPIARASTMSRSQEADVDQMVRDMKRANRRPLLIAAGVAFAVVGLCGLYVLSGTSATSEELARRGYTDTVVTRKGVLAFAFNGTKGTARCSGTFERSPGSTSFLESCFDVKPAAAERPPVPENERLERGLRAQLASLAITGAHCAVIEPDAAKTTCTIEAASGPPLDLVFTKASDEWQQDRPERVLQRATLAETVSKELEEKVKAKVTVSCGEGLYGYGPGDALSCTAQRRGVKKPGSIVVTFTPGGGYTWTAKGV